MARRFSTVLGLLLATLLTPCASWSSDANLDPTFGSYGVVRDVPSNLFMRELLLQSDGKLVAVGTSGTKFAAVRYGADGTVDSGFGAGGIAAVDFGESSSDALGGAVQSDGKIVAVGLSASSNGNTQWALARFDTGGTLDSGFGTGGKVLFDPGPGREELGAVAQQPDGKLVAAGRVVGVSSRLVVARFNQDGTFDAGFGSAGIAQAGIDIYGFYYALLLQSDGKILVAGGSEGFARLNPDGSFDTSFGSGGVVTTDYDVLSFLVQPGGKIVAGGGFYAEIEMARFDANGTLDTSFGEDGHVDVYGFAQARRLLAQADGKFIATGASPVDPSSVGLVRFSADGAFDPSFGSGARVDIPFLEETTSQATGLVQQVDGKFVELAYTNATPHEGPLGILLLRFGSATCGDGNVDGDEQCDDGNFESLDCCSVGCGIGSCGRCGICNAQLECVGTPTPGCLPPVASRRSALAIRDDANDTRDLLKWKLRKAPTSTFAQLGDPVFRDDYDFCVYDESGPTPAVRYEKRLRGGEGWRAILGRRYDYFAFLDNSFGDGGNVTADLRPGTSTKATVQAKGPAVFPPAIPLGLPLRVQLRGENGVCFEAVYSNPGRNAAGKFSGKSD